MHETEEISSWQCRATVLIVRTCTCSAPEGPEHRCRAERRSRVSLTKLACVGRAERLYSISFGKRSATSTEAAPMHQEEIKQGSKTTS